MTNLEEYKHLSRNLNKIHPEDRLLSLGRLQALRVVLNISSEPRNMDGWAERTTRAKNSSSTTRWRLI
jgi:hypothetical protein